MKILFLLNEEAIGIECTPEHCEKKPTGGSLTAAIVLGDIFKKRGHEVIFSHDHESITDNMCDIFISLRLWRTFFLGKKPGKKNYLWCQDDIKQPFLEPLKDIATAQKVYSNIDNIFFISHYQAQRWIQEYHVPEEKIWITSNGIDISRFQPSMNKLNRRKAKAFYASTPFRGLSLLLEAWPWVHAAVPEAELQVYSSIQVYGPDEKPEYLELYEKARSLENKGVKYMGSVGQETLRNAAQECRVMAYPCTFPETGCIVAMEAMASGCVIVSTALGALPETAWRNPLVPISENWLQDWTFKVCRTLVDDEYYLHFARHNLLLAPHFDWGLVADKWMRKLEADLK